jgi:uncharacterized protein (DUF2141 family)
MIRILVLALCLILPAGGAFASTLAVTIDGVRSNHGQVMVALFSRSKGFPDGDYADRWAKVPASTGPVTVVFDHLRPGEYAVGAYHDENGNGKLDTNFIGWPEEGYALSNGIRLTVFRPRFIESAFTLQGKEEGVALHMGY